MKYTFHNTESISKIHFLQRTSHITPYTNHSILFHDSINYSYLQYSKYRIKIQKYGSKQQTELMPIIYNRIHSVPQNCFWFLLSQNVTFNSTISDEWQMLPGKSRGQQEQRHNSCCLSYRGTASFHEWKSFSAPAEITACMGRSFSKVEQPYVTQYAFTGSKGYSTYAPSW